MSYASKAPTRLSSTGTAVENVAIVGMSCRFPGARGIDEFRSNLKHGVESVTFFSEGELRAVGSGATVISQPNFVRAHGAVAGADEFDAALFGYSPREAEVLDPQHRVFLECAWEALENAGYDSETFLGSVGVFASASMSTYLLFNVLLSGHSSALSELQAVIANDKDYLATRVSYKLNLRGPSLSIQTACSSSLVGVHLACQSLLTGECDIAVVGGVSIAVPQTRGYVYEEGGILSPDGHCRAFDEKAAGTVGGSGAGVVVLKRLQEALVDGDRIRAVIRGSAINNDGAAKVGYTAPSVEGQAEVIAEALAVAGIVPEEVTYVEAHGTGTTLGDPIEIAALTRAFGRETDKRGWCAIGSVKTNVGHLDTAAGIAGLIKTVLALEHKMIPPSLHFERPNPKIDFAGSPFYVNTKLREWRTERLPRRAGVSSFGIGGTNAHVVLEEAPPGEASGPSRPIQLLTLSAKTPAALEQATKNLVAHFKGHEELALADVAYTLQVGRRAFNHRRVVVCQDREEAVQALERQEAARVLTEACEPGYRPVVFMFPGQGAQHVNMMREIYQVERVFREQVDRCAEILKGQLGRDLREVLYPPNGTVELDQTQLTQPALFVVEYALAQLWMAWGIRPEAMIGHSIGEYVAACLAEVFTLEDALVLVTTRARLMQELPAGGMLVVPLPAAAVEGLLNERLSLAAVNGPALCVVSGAEEAIARLEERLTQQGQQGRRLRTSHAFHSHMMEPALRPFHEAVRKMKLRAPRIPYISNVSGTWITEAQATDAGYWATHLRQTVQFDGGLGEVLRDSKRILLEVGPGHTLESLTKLHPRVGSGRLILGSLRHPQDASSELICLFTTLGKLWCAGVPVDWSALHASERRHRVPLPTYPFQRKRFWLEPNSQPYHATVSAVDSARSEAIADLTIQAKRERTAVRDTPTEVQWSDSSIHDPPRTDAEIRIAMMWKDILGVKEIGISSSFFDLGGHSLAGIQLVQRLRETFSIDIHLNTLFEAPTLASLAEAVEKLKRDGQHLPPILVQMRASGTQPPFFCVHPIGGSVFIFRDIVRYLDPDQPFYAIQALGLTEIGEESDQYACLEDMAEDYVRAIKVVQPIGPYFLGGLSWGGIVAFEMAQLLTGRGEDVAILVLLDTPSPENVGKVLGLDDSFILLEIAKEIAVQRGRTLSLVSRELRDVTPQDQLEHVLDRIKDTNLLPADIDLNWIKRLLSGYRARIKSARDYRPRTYTGRVALFRANEMDDDTKTHMDRVGVGFRDAAFGWGRHCRNTVAIHAIPGDHSTMTLEPNVADLARRLQRCLAEARD